MNKQFNIKEINIIRGKKEFLIAKQGEGTKLSDKECKDLKQYEHIIDVYVEIANDTIDYFMIEEINEDTNNKVEKYINNHKLIKEFSGLLNVNKLKEELKEDICQSLDKHNKNKEITKIYSLIENLDDKKKNNTKLSSTESKRLEDLNNIKDVYNKILKDVIKEFSEEEVDDSLKDKMLDYVDNHELMKDLEQYPRKNKLIKELKEDARNSLKKRVEKKKFDKAALAKGLAVVGGFGLGLALASVPGVGTIRMGIAISKLGLSLYNSKTDGKVTKIINARSDAFLEKHPNIKKQANNIREKIKNHEQTINWFANGLAAGYITGNFIEIFKGGFLKSNTGKIGNKTTKSFSKNNLSKTDTASKVATDSAAKKAADLTLKKGDVLELDNLERGYVSSTAKKSVHLMQNLGDKYKITSIKKVGNKTMVHLNTMSDGDNYAWFDLKTIENELKAGGKVLKRVKK